MADFISKKKRSKIMSCIKCSNTKPELLLRKELFKRGYRYMIHYKLRGKPDIVFVSKKIAIFVDGDFWHGYEWKSKGRAPPKGYWQDKINRNIERDKEVDKELQSKGWRVIRIWEHEVKNNIKKCIEEIKKSLD